MIWRVSEALVGGDACGIGTPSAIQFDGGREVGELAFFGEKAHERARAFVDWMNANAGLCTVHHSRRDYRPAAPPIDEPVIVEEGK